MKSSRNLFDTRVPEVEQIFALVFQILNIVVDIFRIIGSMCLRIPVSRPSGFYSGRVSCRLELVGQDIFVPTTQSSTGSNREARVFSGIDNFSSSRMASSPVVSSASHLGEGFLRFPDLEVLQCVRGEMIQAPVILKRALHGLLILSGWILL